MKKTDGGPAFPTVYVEHGEVIELHTGMTKLDYFAAEATCKLPDDLPHHDTLTNLKWANAPKGGNLLEINAALRAKVKYTKAEAMLAESEGRNEATGVKP